jgi:hypothetical protein
MTIKVISAPAKDIERTFPTRLFPLRVDIRKLRELVMKYQ